MMSGSGARALAQVGCMSQTFSPAGTAADRTRSSSAWMTGGSRAPESKTRSYWMTNARSSRRAAHGLEPTGTKARSWSRTLLARLRGTVTLSYSCYSLADDREMFPSSIVLSAFRILSGQRDGDHAALNRWLGPAESFAPEAADKALTEAEWWLWRATGSEDVVDPEIVVGSRYPHLGRGYALARERSRTASPSLTAG